MSDVLASAFTLKLGVDERQRKQQLLKAPTAFNAFGCVVFSDQLLAAVKMSQVVRDAVLRASTGIFNAHVTGRLRASSVDELLIVRDGDQRRQSIYRSQIPPPDRKRKKEAVNLVSKADQAVMVEWENTVVGAVMANVSAVVPEGLEVMASTLICNVLPEGQEAKCQQLHCDVTPKAPPSPEPAPVLILAVDRFFLQVCPGSHRAVQEMMAIDKACQGLPGRTRDAAFSLLPTCPVILLDLQPGDLVVMHGYCVHAGYKPRPGAMDIRAHWYCQMAGSDAFVYNTTYNIEGQVENPLRTKFKYDFVKEKVRGRLYVGA